MTEISLWHRFLIENNIKPKSAPNALSKCNPHFYKNVYTLLHILVILFVTLSYGAEHKHSHHLKKN